ncbi:MAG: metallophosphoesterase [Bradyrhizobiaceae bacterium]|nr:MAG: metallophosphoesterase [Bradyrhizobiaceae bacterium]
MTDHFLLAHLSDPHLGPIPRPRGLELFGKRAIGYVNWQRKRHAIHRRDVLAQIVADIHAQKPDHIAITGDLVNIALPAEFTEAAAWLKTVGSPHDVSLVPGNHDAYDISTRHHHARSWSDYLRGDDGAAPPAFPYVRRRGPLALIGISTAVPTAPFMATGLVGRTQYEALEHILPQLAQENLCRVLMIHHPPYVAPGRRIARLRDADRLRDLLKRYGAEMVLHGHDHRHAAVWLDGPLGKIPVIGVPSSSASSGGHHHPAAYNLFSIAHSNRGWRIEQTVRGFVNETSPDRITDIERKELTAP